MFKRALSLIGAGLLFSLVGLFPSAVNAQCGAGQIDLAEYMVPANGPKYYSMSCPDLVSELQSRVGNPNIAGTVTGHQGELRSFDKNVVEYELYSVTSDKVYAIEDTSWMSTCEDGSEAFYRVYDASTGSLGGGYTRCVTPGRDYPTGPFEIRAFREDDWVLRGELNECDAQGEGVAPLTFQVAAYNPSSDRYGPLGLPADSETIVMRNTSGIGAGEFKYYTKGVGLTGFWDGSFHATYHEGVPGDSQARRKLICDGDSAGKPAVFIYPESSSEIRKYLANSQVYCAPPQMYWPVHPQDSKELQNCRQASDIGPGAGNNDAICDETEYGVVDATETLSANTMSFPLFRSDPGSISIEYDLARVNPADTLASAAARNARSNYSPQFYLSTPQTQCLNAVRYVQTIDEQCNKAGTPGKDCLANLYFSEPIDGALRLLDLRQRNLLTSEDQCVGFSGTGDPGTHDEKLAVAVRSIAPYMPKTFKVGFVVNHVVLSDKNKFNWGQQFLTDTLATWFGQEDGNQVEPATEPQEKVDIIPVWYHAGMTTSEFSGDQLRSYPVDPANDPLMTREKPASDPTNFAGPLWQAYAPVLPVHVQEAIATDKERTVKQNFALMESLQGLLGVDRISRDQLAGLLGADRVTGLKFTDEPFWKQEGYSLPMLCSDPEACRCYKEDEEDTSCLNQTRKSVIDSFPVNFAQRIPNQDEYVEQLRDELLLRINAGVQQTETYPQEIEGQPIGPLSKRFIGTCAVDQDNTKYGVQENSTGIAQDAIQPLGESDDEERAPMVEFFHFLRAKIRGGNSLGETKFQQDRTSRTYIVLPDESLDVEIMQSYLAPLFLSPEMYESIMSGENPQYPFLEDWIARLAEQGVMAGDPSNDPFVSAFLRMNGPDRQLINEDTGYMQVERVSYFTEGDCSRATQGDLRDCKCTSNVSTRSTDEQWIPIEEGEDGEDAHPRNNCVALVPINTRPVAIAGEFPAKSPDGRAQTPGNLFALTEYLRRLAFTPLHMQVFEKYPGLEEFYNSLGGSGSEAGEFSDTVGDYFRATIEGIRDFKQGGSNSCDYLYVSSADANSSAQLLQRIFSQQEVLTFFSTHQGGGARLYGECSGGNCMEFITSTLADTPVCSGDKYINPYLAVAVAMTADGGIRGETGFFFDCGTHAFAGYIPGATLDGKSCTVVNSAGNTVTNPALVTKYGIESGEIYNQCVDKSAASLWASTGRQHTPADGLACFMMRAHNLCATGSNDYEALFSYGYNPRNGGDPSSLAARMEELAVVIRRGVSPAAGSALDRDLTALYNSASEMRANLARCSR